MVKSFFDLISHILQTSLAAARKALVSEHPAGEPGRHDAISPRCYDSEDTMSMDSRTPGGSTPKLSNSFFTARESSNGSVITVNSLAKEFEQRRHIFENDVRGLVEVKAAPPAPNTHPEAELRKLKTRFESWKKDYKIRLKEAKGRLHKLAHSHSEGDRSRRTWWGKLSSRVS